MAARYQAIRRATEGKWWRHWCVTHVADVDGVKFTREQAEAVAALLNEMDQSVEHTTERP